MPQVQVFTEPSGFLERHSFWPFASLAAVFVAWTLIVGLVGAAIPNCPCAKAAVESEAVKKRFHDLSTVAPDANELAPEVLGQLVTRDVAKYKKLLEEKK